MEAITESEFKVWASDPKRNLPLTESHSGFKVGNKVTYTNEFGVSFQDMEIVGIADDSYDFYNRRFFLNKSAYWFPVLASELTLQV